MAARGRTELGDGALMLGMGHYRLFIIAVCAVLTVVLQLILSKTRFGSRLRAAVDDPRVARGPGHQRQRGVPADLRGRLGARGLGGALGAEILGLDPTFPLKYMIYFLIVVSVGGTSSITGPLAAALLLGIADVAGKYFIPKMGAFTVYLLMILILMLAPSRRCSPRKGRPLMGAPSSSSDFQSRAAAQGALASGRVRGLGPGLRAAADSCPRTRCWSTRSPSSRCSRCRST